MSTALPVYPRSLRRRSRALGTLIVAKAILASMVLFVKFEELDLLLEFRSTGRPASLASAAIAREHNLLLNLNNLAMICAIFVWLLWQYGLRRALVSSPTQPFRYGAGTGLIWWFVPFANVVVPFSVMAELWDAEALADRRPLELWWWLWNGQVVLLYVTYSAFIFGVLDAVGLRIASFIAEVLFLLCALPAIRVVRTMTSRAVAGLEAFVPIPPAPLEPAGASLQPLGPMDVVS